MKKPMTGSRFPWFPCFQGDLMTALSPMDCYERCFYMCVLVNIYDNGGPISADERQLARRTALSVPKVKACLKSLIAAGKLIMADGMISNPRAEKIIKEREERAEVLRKARALAAQARWSGKTKKPKENNDGDMQDSMQNGCNQVCKTTVEPESESDKKEKTVKKENPEAGNEAPTAPRAKRSRECATRLPEDWKLTPELGNYGRGRGLTSREVINESEKFVRYWRGLGGQKARKLDWKATWEKWCITAAERLGRSPRPVDGRDPQQPENFDRRTWETIATIYENSNNWKRSWGPEPGPRCKMPADLLKKFVNPQLTGQPDHAMTAPA